MSFDREVLGRVFFENLGVAVNIVFQNFRNLGVFEDRLPWASRLTRCAVDAFIWMYIKLIGPLLIRYCQLINAIHWTDFYTFNVFTVDAQLCNDPRHNGFLLSLNCSSVRFRCNLPVCPCGRPT